MKKTTVPEKGFYFRETDHRYFYDGTPLTGVTTVLGTLNKPALIGWAAKMAVEYVSENRTKIINEKSQLITEEFDKVLEEAKTAHARKRDTAAEKGTDLHALAETWVKRCMTENGGMAVSSEEKSIFPFTNWAVANKIKFLESEKKMYAEDIGLAGTCDLVFEKDGKKYVGDIKTTSGIYDMSPFLQCAAYRLMLEKMGETGFYGSLIIRLGKDGSFEEFYRLDEKGEDMDTFLSLFKVYKAVNHFKNTL